MKQNKTYTREGQRPKVSRTPLESQQTHGTPHGSQTLKVNPPNSTLPLTGVQLRTTSTYSSVSATLVAALSLAIGRSFLSLVASPHETKDCTTKSAAKHTVSFRTDSGFAKLACSSLLSNFSTGA